MAGYGRIAQKSHHNWRRTHHIKATFLTFLYGLETIGTGDRHFVRKYS
jgi:hypothetical protein